MMPPISRPLDAMSKARFEFRWRDQFALALDPETATPGLKLLLARAGHVPDFAALREKLAHAQARSRALYDKIMRPA